MKDYLVYSSSKAVYHVDKIKALQQGKPIIPLTLQVDLEAYCNDSCVFCAYRKEDAYNNQMLKLLNLKPEEKHMDYKPLGTPNKNSGLPVDMAVLLPKMLKEAGIPAIEITGGGEPTLWKAFDELIFHLMDQGIEIGLVTNASNLSDDRIELLAKACTWIRFSMDSSNPELHKDMHRTPNSDFIRRIGAITRIIDARDKLGKTWEDLVIGISFIVTPINLHDCENSAIFYKKLGADHIRFSFMYDKSGNAGLTMEQIAELKIRLDKIKESLQDEKFKIFYERNRLDTYSRPNDDFDKCYMQRFVWALGADCKVYPCCIMKYHTEFAFGDIREKSLKTLVSDNFVLDKMNNLNVKSCNPCWLRDRNKAQAYSIEKPMHANFI